MNVVLRSFNLSGKFRKRSGRPRPWLTVAGMFLLVVAWMPCLIGSILGIFRCSGSHEVRCSMLPNGGFEIVLHHAEGAGSWHHHTPVEQVLFGDPNEHHPDHQIGVGSGRNELLPDGKLPEVSPVVMESLPWELEGREVEFFPACLAEEEACALSRDGPPIWRGGVMRI